MYCMKCGTLLEDDARFCPNCGTPVEEKRQPSKHFTFNDDYHEDTYQRVNDDSRFDGYRYAMKLPIAKDYLEFNMNVVSIDEDRELLNLVGSASLLDIHVKAVSLDGKSLLFTAKASSRISRKTHVNIIRNKKTCAKVEYTNSEETVIPELGITTKIVDDTSEYVYQKGVEIARIYEVNKGSEYHIYYNDKAKRLALLYIIAAWHVTFLENNYDE